MLIDESEERLRYTEQNNVSPQNAQRVVSIQFVDEGGVTEVLEDHFDYFDLLPCPVIDRKTNSHL